MISSKEEVLSMISAHVIKMFNILSSYCKYVFMSFFLQVKLEIMCW